MTTATQEIKVGYELPSVTKTAKMGDFSDRSNSIHNDDQARRMGYQGGLIPGMMSAGYMEEILARFFGERWLREGKIGTRFISPMYSGDTILTKGIVTEKVTEGDTVRLVIDLWSENQQGQKVSLGTASCPVS